MIYFDYYITRLAIIGRGERGKVPYYSSTILLLSPFLFRDSDYKKDDNKLLLDLSKQQQTLQTEREPEVETEIECPRCYDIMTLSYDFDKLYYFCEECNLSLLIN
jgi:hypothetical protein